MAQLLPPRSKVKTQDTWDLSSLCASDAAWEKDFARWAKMEGGYAKFRGKLASSPKTLAACLRFDREVDELSERLGNYAFLHNAEDLANSHYERMKGRFASVASKMGQAASYIRPEIIAIPAAKMKKFMADKSLAEWKLVLERLVRHQPHTLSAEGEKLLAMQSEMAQASSSIFRQLHDADMRFGLVKDEKGKELELSHSSYNMLLHSAKRSVRAEAFHQYYKQYECHKNSLVASLNASNQCDVYYARARNHATAREASLFQDNVPLSVYDNLITAVHKNLPSVHRYLEVRRRAMKLKELHHYDTYVPILSSIQTEYPWDKAVSLVISSLQPLGSEYCGVLEEGLTSARWCDRYSNQGKRSGAFSSGGFTSKPYILMNYQPKVLDHVFTLTHEAGHSMHTYYSARNQPYQYYGYTIFVAEVASTFNEQLLSHYMMSKAQTKMERAYLINRLIDSIRGTIIRQTMFAEFEKVSHALVESGEPLTVESIRAEYRKLLEMYFGKGFAIDKELELECLRIPHFYSAFYVYKYATGLSASIALSQRVLNGKDRELQDYLGFLKGGCSKWPLDLLRGAGVDMEKPQPVNTALAYFGELVDELDTLL